MWQEKKTILHSLSLSIAAGEIVALVGPNGAGKSTLARCLCRLLPCSSGRISLYNQDICSYPTSILARQICYVPQLPEALPAFTVREYVTLGRHPHLPAWGALSSEDHAMIEEALLRTGMADFQSRQLRTLSGGEMQSVQIAAALAQHTGILILDEPTAFLDPPHQEAILGLLSRLNREEKTTILWVTHDLNAAIMISHRVLALRRGEIIFSGPAQALADVDILRRLYDMTFYLSPHPVTRQLTLAAVGADAALRNFVENPASAPENLLTVTTYQDIT